MTVVRSRFEPQPNNLYETEQWATEALLRHFPVEGLNVWEPAAGNHKMADVLRANGATVWTSDIETYSRDHDEIFDFLLWNETCPYADAIITNPPYGPLNSEAQRFAEMALDRCAGLVALLLTAKFDFGKTRCHLFRDNPRFCAKINLIDRIQWFEGEYGGTEDHAWYVWAGGAGWSSSQLLYEGKQAS